ncbi:hypothetical protein BD414DRAFT_538213 [Trametes punicea]|nr:hypothetical protein BD414DRAFT_538213 [Trametes punicea]
MYTKSFVAGALLVLGAQAAPAKRDSASFPVLSVTGFGSVTLSGLPTAPTSLSPDQGISFVQANSQALASAVGTATVLDLEAAYVMAQVATQIAPTETQLTVFMADVAGTPVVEVSSIGGPAITIATGTAGGTVTSFAGHVFTAAPKTSDATAGLGVPRALVAGALTLIGSMFVGALAVL